jgi:hypothetical protein
MRQRGFIPYIKLEFFKKFSSRYNDKHRKFRQKINLKKGAEIFKEPLKGRCGFKVGVNRRLDTPRFTKNKRRVIKKINFFDSNILFI